MNTNRVLIIMAFVAGMLGGILSSSFMNTINCETITAQYIRLVDNEGNALMKLYATPKFDDDMWDNGIELYNTNGSIFSQWSSHTQALQLHDSQDVNKGFILGTRHIALKDENGVRLLLGGFRQHPKYRDNPDIKPAFMVVLDEEGNNIWSAP